MSVVEERGLRDRVGSIEALVARVEALGDPEARACAVAAIQAILELHGAGLERMLDIVADSGERSEPLFSGFVRDDLVSSLLLLHGLHPIPLEDRVRAALESVRPYLQSHGGNVELLGVDDDVVRLRLQGSCHGCASSAMILERAPDSAGLEVEGVVEEPPAAPLPAGFVPLASLTSSRPPSRSPAWTELHGVVLPSDGDVRPAELAGLRLVLCRARGRLYAYRATCRGCGESLEGARLDGTELVCPACTHHFDVVRAGGCVDDDTLSIEPLPLLEEHGLVRVAAPAGTVRP